MEQWNHSIWDIWINRQVYVMRARVHQNCRNGLHWGQIWNEKHNRWETVTMSSITAWGARRALAKYVKRNRIEKEFEI